MNSVLRWSYITMDYFNKTDGRSTGRSGEFDSKECFEIEEKSNLPELQYKISDQPEFGGSLEQAEILEVDPETLDETVWKGETVRGLKPRHVQLIAIGGAIGTGLFIGTGAVLRECGPAPLLMSYIVMAIFVWFMMNIEGEMVTFIPVAGETTMYAIVKKYCSNEFAFAAGWNLFYAQAVTVPAEITACAFLVQYWTDLNPAIFISIFFVLIMLISFCPIKVFGEAEFWISIIKILCIVGLIICGIVILFGGAPKQHAVLGFHYWKHPGAFKEYLVPGSTGKFLAFWTALIKSGFSFIFSPELITSCAAEAENPRRNIPKACKRFVYRLVLFYVCSALVIGVIIGSDDPKLMDTSGSSTAAGSPFVIGLQNVGIKVLNHIVNACILTSAFSSGNAQLFGATRGLYTMALRGDAPKIFARVNHYGTPIYAVALSVAISLLAYLNCSSSSAQVFTWLTNISTISGFFSWIFGAITYLRFRKIVAYHKLEDRITYRPRFQIFGAYACIFFFSLLSLTNGYAVFFPSNWSVANFFAAYITIPIVVVLYFGCRLYRHERNTFFNVADVNILGLLNRAEREAAEEQKSEPRNKAEKVFDWMF